MAAVSGDRASTHAAAFPLEVLEARFLLSALGPADWPGPSPAGGAEAVVAVAPFALETSEAIQKPLSALSLQFSADVSACLSADCLVLRNDTKDVAIPAGAMAMDYEAGTNIATWRFPGLADGVLSAGRFTARLAAEGIADALGAPLDGDGDGAPGGDLELSFLVTAAGDANLDGWVSRHDLLRLKAGFGMAGGAGWSDGDFDGDGDVDVRDYLALKQGHGAEFIPDRPPAFATPVPGKFLIAPGGGGLTIGIDGHDPDGDALAISAVSDDPYLTVLAPAGNRFARLHFVASDGTTVIGDIVVELLGGASQSASDRFITLATNHVNADGTLDPAGVPFYSDVPVHRVIDDFMIQTGDAVSGNGQGGSPLGDFADSFDPVLSFVGRGALAMANSGADTNDSQFFITEVPTTWLDGKHMIFGQVISGWDVLETISELPTDSNGRPLNVPLLESVEVLDSPQDGALTFVAASGFSDDAHVTITLADGRGGTAQRVITVSQKVSVEAPAELTVFPGEVATFTPTIARNPGGQIQVSATASTTQMAGRVTVDPQTYQVTVDVPAGITVSSFTITVSAMDVGDFDNGAVVTDQVTIRTAGDLPVIGEIGDIHLAPGEVRTIAAGITDDGPRTLNLSISASPTSLAASLDPATHEIALTAPVAVSGLFAVTISAAESGFTDRTPTTRTFYVYVQGPSDPPLIGRVATNPDGLAEAVVQLGDRMYVASGEAGVEVLDVSNPAASVSLGSYPTANSVMDVLVREVAEPDGPATILYAAETYGGVLILDATDPADIRRLASVPLGGGAAVSLALSGDLLYVANWTGGMSIVDVSDPAAAHVVGAAKSFTSPSAFTISYAAAVVVSGSYAYLVDAAGGFVVLNVSDPAHVAYVRAQGTGSSPWDAVIRGDVLYVLDQTNGIIAWTIQDPAQPGFLGYRPMALPAWTAMDVSGPLAVVSTANGYALLNVSNPGAMTQVYAFTGPEEGWYPSFHGTNLALPLGAHGVVLLDVSGLL